MVCRLEIVYLSFWQEIPHLKSKEKTLISTNNLYKLLRRNDTSTNVLIFLIICSQDLNPFNPRIVKLKVSLPVVQILASMDETLLTVMIQMIEIEQ